MENKIVLHKEEIEKILSDKMYVHVGIVQGHRLYKHRSLIYYILFAICFAVI